jgi:restriction system protein
VPRLAPPMPPTITAVLNPDHPDARPSLTVSSFIIPERAVHEGVLIRSTSDLWTEIVQKLGSDWSQAFHLKPEQWEELIAGAFKKAGYDDVTLTPRSGDHGRDVIAVKHGVGCVKIIGSVKAYKPGLLVDYDAIRALLGVMSGERDVSKGIITTTSDFPPRVGEDPFIKPFIPTRLELINGKNLQRWLTELNAPNVTAA